jgi:pyridoxamine 5'-phosphate oxidase
MFAGMEPTHGNLTPSSELSTPAVTLRLSDLDPDPMRQFAIWFEAALAARLPEPNAMVLATASARGFPSARVVLLKDCDAQGFVFFTNYESQKGRDLAENPRLALVFFWSPLERQIRVTGTAAKVSRVESEQYFHSRPVGSQVGAWASKQSQVLPNREDLDRRFRELSLHYERQPVPLPPYWGGYRVQPATIEFWQARVNRLHDRFRYSRSGERSGDGKWHIERLSP